MSGGWGYVLRAARFGLASVPTKFTGTPFLTAAPSSAASQLVRRTQPWDCCLPISVGSGRAVDAVGGDVERDPGRTHRVVGPGRDAQLALGAVGRERQPRRVVEVGRVRRDRRHRELAARRRALGRADRGRILGGQLAVVAEHPHLVVRLVDLDAARLVVARRPRRGDHQQRPDLREVGLRVQRLQQLLAHVEALGERLLGGRVGERRQLGERRVVLRQRADERPGLVGGGDLVGLHHRPGSRRR